MVFTTLAIIAALIAILLTYLRNCYQYWTKKNVFQLEPKFLFGNRPAKGVHPVLFYQECYELFKKKGVKYGGLYTFTKPILLLIDVEMVKNIMAKDFQYFPVRGYVPADDDTSLEANMLRLSGTRWKTLRSKLTPTFTSGKMKGMFSTLKDCLVPMKERVDKICESHTPVDIKDLVACYTTDVIGSCAFGLDCNSFDEKVESPFRTNGKKVFAETSFGRLKSLMKTIYPTISQILKIKSNSKDVEDFFTNVVDDVVAIRKKNASKRPDFLQLLIDLMDDGVLKMHEVAAQSFLFFLAGFETSSTATTFTLYMLAKNLEIQEKLRREIHATLAKHGDEITYEAIQEMEYLDQVVNESLRILPPAGLLPRRCEQDYKVPNDDLIIEKGTVVFIPVYAIHHDEEYYPEPEKFIPERFSTENKKTRPHFTHLPFGEGPRICIGLRFGLLQTKVALVKLLQHYKFTVNKKTQEPLVFVPSAGILTAEGDIWLNTEKV